ncbi:hypothetical protein FOZ60_016129 [Perkinsus olseni]|uniref:Uncharacterized protein n=1 Tax=Perkinsus olseni TaxID=32597 RepID=A0A7J6P707_PEROL|nr:hypothetical protein FOZ60_016129 [Perkinsus olseni]
MMKLLAAWLIIVATQAQVDPRDLFIGQYILDLDSSGFVIATVDEDGFIDFLFGYPNRPLVSSPPLPLSGGPSDYVIRYRDGDFDFIRDLIKRSAPEANIQNGDFTELTGFSAVRFGTRFGGKKVDFRRSALPLRPGKYRYTEGPSFTLTAYTSNANATIVVVDCGGRQLFQQIGDLVVSERTNIYYAFANPELPKFIADVAETCSRPDLLTSFSYFSVFSATDDRVYMQLNGWDGPTFALDRSE